METQNREHPSALHLAALALGKLKSDVAAKVQSHLDECGDCRRYVSDTPRDELAEIVRQARNKASAEQNTLVSGLSGTVGDVTSPPMAASGRAVTPTPAASNNRVVHAVSENEIPRDLYEQTKYRIVRILGRGGMGTVYEAEHVRMKRPVAIKVINPELVDHPQALARFEEEIRAVASLDHANIARAFDAENIGSLQVFVMEFVRGQTLYDFLQSRGQLSVVDACRCVRQALIGLQHAHEQGLVHRDLKPQNLMLTRDTGQIKILDFGLAKAVSENRQSRGLTSSRATMGTYAYMAPEQALDAANADIRADIYSLGCTLYYLLSGTLPFDYETDAKLLLAHQTETPCPLHELCPDVPEPLSKLVSRMLAKNPADRPQTPREAADALLPFARGGSAAPPQPRAVTLQPIVSGRGIYRGSPNRRMWAGSAAVALALFGFGGWTAGLFSVRTPYGTIIIDGVPDNADVAVDGETVNVKRDGDSVTISTVAKGPHHLKLVQGGREIWSDDVTIKLAGELVRAKFQPPKAADKTPPAVAASPKTDSLSETVPSTKDTKDEPSPKVEAPPPAKTADGFTPLFNGRNLMGWEEYKPLAGTWRIENEVLIGRQVSYLYTERDDFRNVHLRVRLRLPERGRFCLYLRGGFGPKEGSQFVDGLELTLGTEAGPHRALYAAGQPMVSKSGPILTPNKLTQVDFMLQGELADVSIDGTPVIDRYRVRNSLLQRTGRIILQSQSGDVEFESVEVKELAESGFTEQIGPVNQPAGGRNATDIAALFPPNSSWTGMGRRGGKEFPVTATVAEVHGNIVVLNYSGRQLRCEVNGSHVEVLGDDPRHTGATGSNFSTSKVEVSGKIVDRELSLDGTEDQWLRGKRQVQGNPVKFVLRRADGPLTGDKNSDAISALVREGAYRQTTQLFWQADPDVFGNLIASAIADANKQMRTPQDARVLGELCLVGGDPVAAERPLRAAIDTAGRPDRPAWSDYKNLTWCLVAQGKNNEARQLFEKELKDRGGPDDMYADADRATAAYLAGVIAEQQYTDQLAAHKELPACFPSFYVGQRREIEDKGEVAVAAYKRCIEIVDPAKPHYVAAFARWRLAVLEEGFAESEEDAKSAADSVAPPELAVGTSPDTAPPKPAVRKLPAKNPKKKSRK